MFVGPRRHEPRRASAARGRGEPGARVHPGHRRGAARRETAQARSDHPRQDECSLTAARIGMSRSRHDCAYLYVGINLRRWGVFNLVGFGGFLLQIGAIALLTRELGWPAFAGNRRRARARGAAEFPGAQPLDVGRSARNVTRRLAAPILAISGGQDRLAPGQPRDDDRARLRRPAARDRQHRSRAPLRDS